MNTVSIVKCKSYNSTEIDNAISQILEDLGGAAKFIKKNDLVVIKPNLLKASLPEENIITHPKIIETVIKNVLQAGGKPVIGDSVAFGSVEKAAIVSGLKDI